MKIIGANITGSFILNSQDITTTIQTSNVWSGSVATDITALNAATASLNRATSSLNAATASLLSYTASNNAAISDILLETASFNAFSSSILNYTASTTTAISDILLETASFNAFSASILNHTASTNTAISDILLETASINTFTSSIDGRVSTIEGKYITTGSNTFVGVQYVSNTTQATTFTSTASLYTDGGLRIGKDAYVSGSAFIKGNLTVFGTSSIEYVTSSVFVGLEYIDLNTDLPALRYAGIRVYDSGSNVGVTGSLFWDSQTNHWVYANPSGSSYSGGMMISGPRASSLGSEQGTTNNALMKGQGGDHITSSAILDDGTSLRIPYLTIVNGTVGATTFSGSGANLTSIPNAALTNSSVTVTAGTGLSGGGSVSLGSSVTLTNAGVTSIVAGTNISISGGTGAVTITNGVTNNNQLTNGAGYITSGGSISGAAARISTKDNRTISPSSDNASELRFGFTSWANNNSSPWADYLHLRSYSDGSGGADNLVTFLKSGIGMRIWQQSFGSGTAYSSYVDVLHSSNYSSYALPITGGAISGTLTVNSNTTSGAAAGVINLGTSADPSDIANSSIIGLTWGLRADSQPYYMVRSNKLTYGGYSYNRLDLSWHTGIVIGAATTYGGIRFWNNSTNIGSSIASIGDGDNNLRSTADIIAYASDKRLKENIINIPNALDKIKQINGVYFDWKDKTKELGFEPSQKHDVGVIAQEIQAILPEVVTLAPFDYELGKSKSGEDYLTVKYEKIVPLLIEAIKEQQTQIEELKTIINGLTK